MSKKKKKDVSKRQQQIREKLAERNREEIEGTAESRRLWFATTLIKNSGMTRKQIGRAMGMSPENLHNSLDIQDDCYLSVLKRIMWTIGIDCAVRFDIPPIHVKKETTKKKPQYDFTGNINIEVNNSRTDAVVNCPEDANMRFLADLIMHMGTSARHVADLSGISASTFMRFFKQDDIKISFLCRIAEGTGRRIVWNLNKKR